MDKVENLGFASLGCLISGFGLMFLSPIGYSYVSLFGHIMLFLGLAIITIGIILLFVFAKKLPIPIKEHKIYKGIQNEECE